MGGSSGHSKANCPSPRKELPRSFPSNCTHLGAQKPLEPEANVFAINRKNVYRAPTVYQAAHTQALPASSMLFDKTCPSCLLGQIPGRQHGLQVRHVKAGRKHPICALPPEAVTPRTGRVTGIFWRLFQVCLGRRAGVPQELPSGHISHLTIPRTWWKPSPGLFCLGRASASFFLTVPMVKGQVKSEKQVQGGLCPPLRTRGQKRRWRGGLRAQLTERGLWR